MTKPSVHNMTVTHKSSLSNPLDRLPSELLSKIFQFVTMRSISTRAQTPDRHIYLIDQEFNTNEQYISPLSLCRICRRWRAIAFSTPSLWAILQPVFRHPLDDGYEVELLQQWIERSGRSFSLFVIGELYLSTKGYAPTKYIGTAQKITTAIISALPKCRTIYINAVYDKLLLISDILASISDPSVEKALLEEVCIAGKDQDTGVNLGSCPMLRSAKAYGHNVIRFGAEQYRTVRHLDLFVSTSYLHGILKRFQNLEECIARVEKWSVVPDEYDLIYRQYTSSHAVDSHIIHHIKILDLYIDTSETDFIGLLQDVTLPSLTDLRVKTLSGLFIHQTTLLLFLLPFFRRSRPPLQSLALEGIPIQDTDLVRALSMFPMLKHLTLKATLNLRTMFFDALCGVQTIDSDLDKQDKNFSPNALCPRLETLIIEFNGFMRLDFCYDMFKARLPKDNSSNLATASSSSRALKSIEVLQCPPTVYNGLGGFSWDQIFVEVAVVEGAAMRGDTLVFTSTL